MATQIATDVLWGTGPKIYFNFSYDKQRNGSTQQYQITFSCEPITGTSFFGYPIYLEIKLDGSIKEVKTFKTASPSRWASDIIYTTDWLSVANKTSGTTSLTIRIYSGSGITRESTYTYTLAVDPAETEIGASDADIGSTSSVVVDRKDDSFTHSIAYQFGSLNGYLTSAGGVSSTEVKFSKESIAFKIPTSFYAQIPDAPSGICTLTCKTYSGSVQVGKAQTCTFTVKVNQENSKPVVTGTIVDVNSKTVELTGDSSLLVRGKSTARCTIDVQTRNYAGSVKSRKIGGVEIGSKTTRDIANINVEKVTFYAKDSRGYDNSYDAAVSLIPYVILTNNATGKRTGPTDSTAILTLAGKYYNGSFGAQENTLAITYSVDGGDTVAITPTIVGNEYSATVEVQNLDYQKAYTISVVVSDKLDTKAKNVPILKGIPVFDWGEEDFAFNVPVHARKGIVADAEWVDLTLSEDFVLYEGNQAYQPQYKVFGNVVTVRGVVAPKEEITALTSALALASGIPSEYRPKYTVTFICQGSGVNRWACSIHSNGNVGVCRYGATSIINIPTTAWLPFCVTYQI